MVKAILFDLDGTLLPMDQDAFLRAYLGGMAARMAPHGYDPRLLVSSVWKGTGAMVQNDGAQTNETVFWDTFSRCMGRDTRADEPIFTEFYRQEFQSVRHVCGFDPRAAEVIRLVRERGFRAILATNPLFPAIATHSRIRWAGLEPEEFALITTFENSRHCKPNPAYYRDILAQQSLLPEECVMVGNDVGEDMIAKTLGMQVFLLTDNLINKDSLPIHGYPRGSFPELLEFLGGL